MKNLFFTGMWIWHCEELDVIEMLSQGMSHAAQSCRLLCGDVRPEELIKMLSRDERRLVGSEVAF